MMDQSIMEEKKNVLVTESIKLVKNARECAWSLVENYLAICALYKEAGIKKKYTQKAFCEDVDMNASMFNKMLWSYNLVKEENKTDFFGDGFKWSSIYGEYHDGKTEGDDGDDTAEGATSSQGVSFETAFKALLSTMEDKTVTTVKIGNKKVTVYKAVMEYFENNIITE